MDALNLAFKYFGMDWLAMIFTFGSIYLLGNKSRWGFASMMAGNIFWVILGFLTSSIAMVIANAIFFAMNARGWIKWAGPHLDDSDL